MVQVIHETIIGYRNNHNRRSLNEVITHKGAVEDGGTSPFYSWLKSTPLVEGVTNFIFSWDE